MRVALVHSFYGSDQPSGENGAVEAQMDALRRGGHEVRLFAFRTDELQGEVGFRLRAGMRVATGLGRNPSRQVAEFAPEVIHVHNLFPNISHRWLGRVAVPVVVTVHNYRPLCANGMLYRAGSPCTRCLDDGPHSAALFRCYRGSLAATLPLVVAQRYGSAASVMQRADRVVLLSDLAKDLYLRAGLPADKIVVSPNFLPDGLDQSIVKASDAARGPWLFVGRLSPEKGVEDLLRNWPASHPLEVIGSGPLSERVATAASETPNIMFRGQLSRDQVVQRMSQARGLIVPSRWFEAFPLVYVEALAAGLPVLATRPNVVAETVSREGTGVALPVGGPWHNAIDEAEARFDEFRHRGRRVFEARYSESAFLRRTEQLYGELTAMNRAPQVHS